MSNKQFLVVITYLLIFGGFGFVVGHSVGTDQQIKKYEELRGINNNLYTVIETLENDYDELEIELMWQLESCYQQLGDMQDDYDVNNDGETNSLDLLTLQKYLISKD